MVKIECQGGSVFDPKVYKANWYQENKERLRESRKAYREEHSVELAEYAKQFNILHNDKLKAQKREYYQINRVSMLEGMRMAYVENISKVLLRSAKYRSAKFNVPFDLKVEDVIVPDVCPYLGIELKVNQGAASISSPSLDRIVPELGYVPGNVQVISHLANTMKSNATVEQLWAFHDAIERLHPRD